MSRRETRTRVRWPALVVVAAVAIAVTNVTYRQTGILGLAAALGVVVLVVPLVVAVMVWRWRQ